MTKEEYNYWLANIPKIGIKKIDGLLKHFGSAENIFKATKKALESFALTSASEGLRMLPADMEGLIQSRNADFIKRDYAKLRERSIYFVSREDKDYPAKLRAIYDAPFGLYYKGRLPKEEKVLAVVGARDCSPYGIEMARYLAGALAKQGIAIISGLARGIDAHAHEGALSASGTTYGILGCGIDICYPRENIRLYMEMQKTGGVLSEYPPGVKPCAGHFPMRNRIISGLSDGILVIEAREKSGSLITVDLGLEQGKEIYALPGKVTDRLSSGCNNLIKMGAKLVTTPYDILEDMGRNFLENQFDNKKNNKILETYGKIVYASLCLEPKHIETIITETELPVECVMEQLLKLELQGLVRQTLKNYYVAEDGSLL